jgi:hypothetical protein
MASAPSITDAHGPELPSGFQPTRVTPGRPVPGSCRVSPGINERVSTRTSCPSSAYISASGLPRNPVPPAMMIFIGVHLQIVAKPGKPRQKRETLALSLGLTNEAAVGFAL